jgi:hypothetical protein
MAKYVGQSHNRLLYCANPLHNVSALPYELSQIFPLQLSQLPERARCCFPQTPLFQGSLPFWRLNSYSATKPSVPIQHCARSCRFFL